MSARNAESRLSLFVSCNSPRSRDPESGGPPLLLVQSIGTPCSAGRPLCSPETTNVAVCFTFFEGDSLKRTLLCAAGSSSSPTLLPTLSLGAKGFASCDRTPRALVGLLVGARRGDLKPKEGAGGLSSVDEVVRWVLYGENRGGRTLDEATAAPAAPRRLGLGTRAAAVDARVRRGRPGEKNSVLPGEKNPEELVEREARGGAAALRS